ncbi:hypothetical protein O181_031856 [Austropuccinia psidii MF-1]|uniref:Transposase domain-containing protein n=1 Tax=Austropuccinia psidii MF-1 TaxID=1389203 RepID=A0A9Q3D1B7_9BASI|nr:hypothetical protein [Austropuccinia psidii MF-1]
MEFCDCQVCVKFSIIDETNQPRFGRYLSVRNVAKHRRADRNRSPPNPSVSSEEYSSLNESGDSLMESDKSFDVEEVNSLGLFIMLFILWLHLFCNVSLESCKVAIKMIINIVNLALEHQNASSYIATISRDPRTLIRKADVDIDFTETICCQQCFSLYKSQRDTPLRCGYKEFSNSECCNQELFVQKIIYKANKDVGEFGHYSAPSSIIPSTIGTPRCVFVSQKISTWLTWLLSKSDTEKVIDEWTESIQHDQEYGYLSDIQHGENFKKIEWKDKPDSLKLALSLFVDWFNPRGNKLSGKAETTGIFALSCLNLPPTLRNKLSHICIFGIAPGPYSPSPQTVNHLLKPIVDELIKLDSDLFIPTYQHPAGRWIQVKLLSVYGDIIATKKVVGFASHSATKFCSFCHAKTSELSLLQLSAKREKNETLAAAKASKAAISKNAQGKLLKSTGVRWSELNRLAYWDPSQHVVLGMMHNWLEGVLQCHFRYRWKSWVIPLYEAQRKRKLPKDSTPKKRQRLDESYDAMDVDQDDISDTSDDSSEDILINSGPEGGFFSQNDMQQFRTLMKQVVLPPGSPHLPANLGESKHGKLSAAQWHTLFVYIIPLVIFELYVDQVGHLDIHSNRYKFLMNTSHLIHCTNIVCARKIKENESKRFKNNYEQYTKRVGELFDSPKVQPNHHFALHIPEQMKSWGPLSGVAEFGGERLIGFLQKINTNNRIDELHKTLMVSGCRMQRLLSKTEFNEFTKDGKKMGGSKKSNNKMIRLVSSRYMLLFTLCSKRDARVVHRDSVPIPNDRHHLSGWVEVVQMAHCNGVKVGCMKPHNCVVAKIGEKKMYGLIKQCYKYKDGMGEAREAILIVPVKNMYPKQRAVPTSRFRYMLFLCGVVLGRIENWKEEMIEPSQVVSLAAYRLLESHTLHIDEDGIIMVPHNHDPFLDISGDF